MNKMNKKLQGLFLCLLVGVIVSNAQPIINASGFNPVIGDNFKWQSTKVISTIPSLSGSNKVWDFSNLVDTGSVTIMSFVSPKGKYYSDSFSNANIALLASQDNSTQLQYDQTDNNGWGVIAYVNLDTTNGHHQSIESNTPRAPYFVYPLTIGTTYTGTHQNKYSLDIPSTSQNIQTSYDTIMGIGYGTLKLPNATYSNVLCVYSGGDYFFVSNGIHFPLLNISKRSDNNISWWKANYNSGIASIAPILTDTGFNPRIGDSYTLQNTKYLNSNITDADLQGANRFWDASSLIDSGSAYTISVISAKGLTGSDSFPSANIAIGSDPFKTISFLETTPSKLGWSGTFTYDSSIYKRHLERDNPSSPEMIYPMTYFQTYNEIGHINYNSWVDIGYFKSQYDTNFNSLSGIGYGTLKLPNATYNNVLCVKKRDKYHLDYWFVTNGIHYPLLHLSNDKNTFFYNNIVYTDWKATYYVGKALPLQITAFSASWQNNAPYLQWNTVNTLNTKAYNIQRSVDGQTFSTIGQVEVSSSTSYHFEDSYISSSTVYYRLQQLDKDGQTFYSNTSMLTRNDKQFSISPNPAKEFATINFNKAVDNAKIEVYDISGKEVISQLLSGSTKTYLLATQSLKNGVYVLKVVTATGSHNEKLLINK